jgi:hypothetical protein
MSRRKTRVLLEIIWDDERDDHPAGWEYKELLEGNPFVGPSSDGVRMVTFVDLGEDGRPEQI